MGFLSYHQIEISFFMPERFKKAITTPEQLQAILGIPSEIAVNKSIDHIDHNCQAFIGASPFLLLGTSNGDQFDVSPKGDPPGFVKVLDEKTLAIPDRKGNRRGDSLYNILENSAVGLLFLIPGLQQSLRVNGKAEIVADEELLESMKHKNSVPQIAIIVHVEEAFMHCTKCIIRSKLWEQADKELTQQVPSLAQVLLDHSQAKKSVEEMEERLKVGERDRLY